MIINTNTTAASASTNLQHSSTMLSRSLSRISSGSKIVTPSDDAAGLAVSEKLNAQNARLKVAKINSQNAMSMMQTTDGFLEEMSLALKRMSELSLLAKDITKGSSDVELYKTEFDQLRLQLRNVVGNGPNGTDSDPKWDISGSKPLGTFNGISLFGERGTLSNVIGSNIDQTMKINSINLREIGSAMTDLLWDSSVAGSGTDLQLDDATAISTLTEAIQQLADSRALIGSIQSRLEFVDSQLIVQSQNVEAANSRIRDVDIAEESTTLARYQILVQAGTSMLSQANSLPESVLRLLQ